MCSSRSHSSILSQFGCTDTCCSLSPSAAAAGSRPTVAAGAPHSSSNYIDIATAATGGAAAGGNGKETQLFASGNVADKDGHTRYPFFYLVCLLCCY